MPRSRPPARPIVRRRAGATLAVAAALTLGVGVAAGPAGATSGQSGTKVASVIASTWWPSARAGLVDQIPAAKKLGLTKVKCPKAVPENVADPESAIADELADFAAGPVKPSLARTGVFACTAKLDGQTLLVVGAISPKGDGHFATGSLILSPERLATSVARAYAQKAGVDAEAVCPGRTVLVVQPDTPIACQARDTATKTATDVDVSVDGQLNATFSFPQ